MDETNKICNVNGCNTPAVITVYSTFVSGIGAGQHSLDYSCEKHATRFRVGQRFHVVGDNGSIQFGFSLRRRPTLVVNSVGPLDDLANVIHRDEIEDEYE